MQRRAGFAVIGAPISDKAREHLAVITAGADLDMLDAVDRDTLCRYCESYVRWLEAEQQISEHGVLVKQNNGFPGENPFISVSHKYSAACSRMEAGVKRILVELNRAMDRAEGLAGDDDEGDPFGLGDLPEIDDD